MQLQSSTDQWQIDDDIPVLDGYYGLTITDHVREMVQRRMTPTEYAAEVAYMWSEMTDTTARYLDPEIDRTLDALISRSSLS